MKLTSKIEFIFMYSSSEVQLWRTFGYISFLQIITGNSGSCMMIILSEQNQRNKDSPGLLYTSKFKNQQLSYGIVAAVCISLCA